MNQIRWSRVLLAGLAAGAVLFLAEAVINGAVLGAVWHEVGPEVEHNAAGFLFFVVLSLAKGVALVACYAVAREVLGARARTVLAVGAVLWLLSSAFPWATFLPMRIFPLRLSLGAPLLGLLATLAALFTGAAVLDRGGAPARQAERSVPIG